jgi:hypothetical protein
MQEQLIDQTRTDFAIIESELACGGDLLRGSRGCRPKAELGADHASDDHDRLDGTLVATLCAMSHLTTLTKRLTGMPGLRWWLTFALWIAAAPASAEKALEVQSWCREIAHAPLMREHKVYLNRTFEDGFCWGAFAAIQTASGFISADQPVLRICAPTEATRVQYIKIFSRYVDQHPEIAHNDFAAIAQRALSDAFPCR